MKKKVLSTILAFTMVVTALVGCGNAGSTANTTSTTADTQTTTEAKTDTQAADTTATETAATPAAELTGIDAIIAEAEGMTMEELAKKAIEESNGKTFYGVG